MTSIGEYSIRKLQEFKGRDFPGFTVELYKGNKKIANLEDHGDGGGVEVHLERARTPLGLDEYYSFVLDDMKQLLKALESKLQKDALWETFLATPYSAAEGFVHLLIELEDIAKAGKSAAKKTPSGGYYVVGMVGSSWFTNDSEGHGTASFSNWSGFVSEEVALASGRKYALKHKEKHGNLIALAALQGDFDWNLSFEDYASLYSA